MDFLHFEDITFHPDKNIGRLCEHLNNIVGESVWFDTFCPQNTKWLSLDNNIVTRINRASVICGCFGLYPSYVAGILHSAETFHFYVLCNKRPNYTDIVLKSLLQSEKCRFQYRVFHDFRA
jgi:hypothetical protein